MEGLPKHPPGSPKRGARGRGSVMHEARKGALGREQKNGGAESASGGRAAVLKKSGERDSGCEEGRRVKKKGEEIHSKNYDRPNDYLRRIKPHFAQNSAGHNTGQV